MGGSWVKATTGSLCIIFVSLYLFKNKKLKRKEKKSNLPDSFLNFKHYFLIS